MKKIQITLYSLMAIITIYDANSSLAPYVSAKIEGGFNTSKIANTNPFGYGFSASIGLKQERQKGYFRHELEFLSFLSNQKSHDSFFDDNTSYRFDSRVYL